MPIIKPIPKKLLTDTVVYKPMSSDQGDGWDDAPGQEQTIERVRVEPTSSMNRTSNSEGKQGNDIVFIDRVNSSYFPKDVKAGDRIDDREVIRVKVLKTFNKIHHLEIELI